MLGDAVVPHQTPRPLNESGGASRNRGWMPRCSVMLIAASPAVAWTVGTGDLKMRPLQAHCHLGLGKLYRRAGRTDEARAELATAVALLRAMGMALWLPEAERELAEAT
jgi:hypothetical protein